MKKSDNIKKFNPNDVAVNNGHFIGLPFEEADAELILQSVPWDVTVSYGDGTYTGARNILEASLQLDLYHADYPDSWKKGIYLKLGHAGLFKRSRKMRRVAALYIQELEAGKKVEDYKDLLHIQKLVNEACEYMVATVKKSCTDLLKAGKKLGLVGGDHSIPLGYLQALAEKYEHFGVLQIDAHQDLRKSYEGFTYSHASIFYNALQIDAIGKLVQVGIRDHCAEEVNFSNAQNGRVVVHRMQAIREAMFNGSSWADYIDKIIADLPEKVYISFDIDGLDPSLCPGTGTPVPGGLSFAEASYLIKRVQQSGKELIGFDLCEVAGVGNDWDGNVGARILYLLSCAMLAE